MLKNKITVLVLLTVTLLLFLYSCSPPPSVETMMDIPIIKATETHRQIITESPETDVPPPKSDPPGTANTPSEDTQNNSQIKNQPDSDSVMLNVENILQKPGLPNGCEVVSLAIVLNYLGYDIDPLTLYYDYMPRSDYQAGSPWSTYVGEATDLGYGCYAPCVVTTANDYLESIGGNNIAKDVSFKKLEEYEKYIDQGIPVILWGMIDMVYEPKLAWAATINNEELVWYSHSHCLVLIGYSEDEYIFCDPLEGIVNYGKYEVLDCFTALFKQACVIEKFERPEETEFFEETVITEEEASPEEPEYYPEETEPDLEPEEPVYPEDNTAEEYYEDEPI